jgi:hypothetical protein
VQQHALAAGLARPDWAQACPALGRFGPAQLGRVLDQQVGARGLQLPNNNLAVSGLKRIRGGLRVAQQLVGGFAGIGLPLAQARNTRPRLPRPAGGQRYRPPGAADIAQPNPTKMRVRPLLRLTKVLRNTHARKLPPPKKTGRATRPALF